MKSTPLPRESESERWADLALPAVRMEGGRGPGMWGLWKWGGGQEPGLPGVPGGTNPAHAWVLGLQTPDCQRISVCVLSHCVCGDLLQQP